MTKRSADATVEVLRIDDLETIRMVSDPTRMAILQAFSAEPDEALTVKRLGQVLGMPAVKLYYHVGLLEEHGLIRVVGTRMVSGIVEKRYGPTARRLEIDRSVFGAVSPAADEAFEQVVGNLFDALRREVADGVRSGSIVLGESGDRNRRLSLTKSIARLSPARAEELRERLTDLIAEFEGDRPGPDAIEMAWFAAAYPLPERPRSARRRPAPATARTAEPSDPDPTR